MRKLIKQVLVLLLSILVEAGNQSRSSNKNLKSGKSRNSTNSNFSSIQTVEGCISQQTLCTNRKLNSSERQYWLKLFQPCYQLIKGLNDENRGNSCSYDTETNSTSYDDEEAGELERICNCIDGRRFFSQCNALQEDDALSNSKSMLPVLLIVFLFLIGISAVALNFAVITYNCYIIKQRYFNMSRVEKVCSATSVNLSLADILMGIYSLSLAIRAFSTLNYVEKTRKEWLTSTTCNSLGIINYISSQVSVTTLVIISTVRLYCVVYPFKKINIKFVMVLLATSWIAWIIVSVIPVLDILEIKNSFLNIIEYEGQIFHRRSLNCLLRLLGRKCKKSCKETIAINFQSRLTLAKYIHDAGIGKNTSNFSNSAATSNSEYYGYYNQRSVCTMNYFIFKSTEIESKMYTLATLLFNLLSFIFILVAQMIIFRKTHTNRSFLELFKFNKTKKAQSFVDPREKEYQEMHRRMFCIVATDFCCWIPLILLSLTVLINSHVYGREWRRKNFKNMRYCFQFMVAIIIPINSLLNPLLYSTRVWKLCRGLVRRSQGNQGETEGIEMQRVAMSSNTKL